MKKVKKRQVLIVEKRRLHRFGGSLGIFLPPKFIAAHNLKEGDEIPVLANHILKIVPMAEGIVEGEDESKESK